MRTIVMDTSNTYLMVALYENDTCITYMQEEGNRRQSEYALLQLRALLEKHTLEIKDIDEMVITIGPGSYTGVRVALTIAKTLATVTTIKIKAVSSLQAHVGKQKAISILDARSEKVFVGVYNNGEAMCKDTIVSIVAFPQFIETYPDYQIVGDGHLVGFEKTTPKLYETIYEVSKEQGYVVDIDTLVPEYIKEFEAKKIC